MSAKILVLRLSSFGDILHTLPAVAALRASHPPPVEIGWAVEERWREVVELVAPVDRHLIVRRSISAFPELARNLRQFASGAMTIDFQGLLKSSVLGRISGASRRVGFSAATVRERASLLFTNERVPVDPSLHVVEQNLALARACGAERLPPPLDFRRFETPAPVSCGPSTLLLNPGAAHSAKQWPAAKFAELGREAARRFGLRPLVVWGPGEEPLARAVAAEAGAEVAPRTTLRELAWLVRRSALMVAGDTGPLHLAAAMGAKVVGLYGPTNPGRNGPWGQLDRVVESWTSTRRMDSIAVAPVLSRIQEVL